MHRCRMSGERVAVSQLPLMYLSRLIDAKIVLLPPPRDLRNCPANMMVASKVTNMIVRGSFNKE